MSLSVVCLCARWCGICRDWQPVIEAMAVEQPQWQWRWLDIEDEANLVDDLEVEAFPTLLVGRGIDVLFFGPVPPQPEVLARILASLRDAPPAVDVPTTVQSLWRRFNSERESQSDASDGF